MTAELRTRALVYAWQLGAVVTFVFLTFFDGYRYEWWNVPIALATNFLLSQIWPIYWLLLRPALG